MQVNKRGVTARAITGLALLCLVNTHPAVAQTTFYTSNATISSAVSGSAYVGIDNTYTIVSPAPTVNVVTGGSFGYGLDAYGGSTVNFTGGSLGSYLTARNSSVVSIAGGTFGQYAGINFFDQTNGSFTFVGTGLGATLVGPDTIFGGAVDYRLSGVLQDGHSLNGDIVNVALGARMFTLVASPEPSQTAALGLGFLSLCGLALRARKKTYAV